MKVSSSSHCYILLDIPLWNYSMDPYLFILYIDYTCMYILSGGTASGIRKKYRMLDFHSGFKSIKKIKKNIHMTTDSGIFFISPNYSHKSYFTFLLRVSSPSIENYKERPYQLTAGTLYLWDVSRWLSLLLFFFVFFFILVFFFFVSMFSFIKNSESCGIQC